MGTLHACRELEESFLHAYVDGEFSPEDCAEVRTHLARCAVCTAAVQLQQSYKAALRRAAIQAPHALLDQVRVQLGDEAVEGRWVRAVREPKAIGFAAAAAGAAVWFLAGGLHHPLLSRRSALVDDGVAIHAKALPLDYAASDVSSAQHWLDSRLDFGARLPRFAGGTQLQGVRLSNLNSHPAALVTYTVPQGDGRRVSLLIVDDPDASLQGRSQRVANREVWLSQARGFNVASWRNDEVTYSLISDLDERDVLALVQAAQQR
jgi:anti-sigma factor RsiW